MYSKLVMKQLWFFSQKYSEMRNDPDFLVMVMIIWWWSTIKMMARWLLLILVCFGMIYWCLQGFPAVYSPPNKYHNLQITPKPIQVISAYIRWHHQTPPHKSAHAPDITRHAPDITRHPQTPPDMHQTMSDRLVLVLWWFIELYTWSRFLALTGDGQRCYKRSSRT